MASVPLNRIPTVNLALLLLVIGPATASVAEVSAARAPFRNFESGPVNALVVTPDAKRLLALNTSDHRVEVYRLAPGGGVAPPSGSPSPGGAAGPALLQPEGAVFTGLEPVAMALHPDAPDRLFVSNHVSDTVSVVDLATLDVVFTLQAGDEPQGLVVVNDRLFVTAARAPATPSAPGQVPPRELVANVVVVFRASPPFERIAVVPVRGLKPRDACAVGDTVYVIPQNSGNRTTILDENHTFALGLSQEVPDAFDGGPFAVNPVLFHPELTPAKFARGWYVPRAGRIVFDHEYPGLTAELPDYDVIAIDARTLDVRGAVRGVGTTLFDVEANPHTGELWVANTDARNRTRFEPRLRGRAVENRVTIVDPARGRAKAILLEEPRVSHTLAQPAVIAFCGAGGDEVAYVASLQSARVGVLDATTGAEIGSIATAGIPSGLAVSPAHGLLFVYTREDHAIRAYDLAAPFRERHAVGLAYDPEPPFVRRGRMHLYEARPDRGHGSGAMACASCHVFGHTDALAWDLGDPEGSLAYYYPDILQGVASFPGELVVAPTTPVVHPLKGPMVTQSLRGLMDRDEKDDLTFHWRGERRTIHTFQPAFASLLGGDGIDDLAMQELGAFVRSIDYAPNPFQPKDRVYQGDAALGADIFGMNPSFSGKPYKDPEGPSCIDCHQGDFFAKTDFTGGRPVASAGSFTQIFQTAQMRMVYEKDFRDLVGFGALHDGAVDGIRGFLDFTIPNSSTPTFGLLSPAEKDQIAAFGKAWDHGLAPIVGAQFTLTQATLPQAAAFLDLAEAQAQTSPANADLILKGWRQLPGQPRLKRGAVFSADAAGQTWGYLFDTGDFVDRAVVLQVVAAGIAEFTFTCVPPGQGVRLGVDRDEDGLLDFQEGEIGADPADPDTDGDGYTDGFEVQSGGDPLVADATLPDTVPPEIEGDQAMEVFVDRATISFVTDEPASVRVDVGSAPGLADVTSASDPALRRTHEVMLLGLPAGTTLYYRITATDKGGLQATADGSLETLPPFVHVESIELEVSGSGPYTVTARVEVRDHTDQPVAGIPLLGLFSGDLGGQPWQQLAQTGSDGVAAISTAPFTPAGPTEIGFSPAYVGSPFPGSPWFVGLGGDTPAVFYDQTRNRAHYAVVQLP